MKIQQENFSQTLAYESKIFDIISEGFVCLYYNSKQLLLKNLIIMDKVIKMFENFTTSASLQIRIDAKPDQKFFKSKAGGKKKRTLAVFKGDDSISGIVEINIKQGEELEHFGVKVMLIGYLDIYDDNTLSTQFSSLSKQLMPVGTIRSRTVLKFKFQNFDKDYESFYGVCGEVRYFIRAVIVLDKYIPNITKQVPFVVFKPQDPQKFKNTVPIKIDVGSEGKLNIKLQIYKNSFHLKDCIEGMVTFTQLNVELRNMELWLIRKQKLGSEKLVENDTQTMIQYQLMDGSPEVGQIIPIRLYLHGVAGLSPSFTSLHDRLTVSYLLKLMIQDSFGKKYFKQAPITLYRHMKSNS